MSVTIENPETNRQSIRVVLANRTYRGALSMNEQIIDQHYGGQRESRFRAAEALANARLRSADGVVLAPGDIQTLTSAEDVTDALDQTAALQGLGLVVTEV